MSNELINSCSTLNRLPLTPFGEAFEFKAVGKLWTVPATLTPALGMLHNATSRRVAELGAVLTSDAARDDLKKSLAVLARSGVVLVEKQT